MDTSNYINSRKLNEREKEMIIQKIEDSQKSSEQSVDFKALFNKHYLSTSIILIIIHLMNALNDYGLDLIFTLNDEKLKAGEKNADYMVSKDLAILTIIEIPFPLITGLLCEIPSFGRKKTMIIGNMLSLLFIVICIFNTHLIYIWFGLTVACLNLTIIASHCYGAEVYNTLIRNKALGILLGSSRIGAFVSQFIFVELNKKNTYAPYYYSIVTNLIIAGIICLLPYETYGKPLEGDDDTNNNNNNEGLIIENDDLINLKENESVN